MKCSKCGEPLTPGTPAGLCLNCLTKMGVEGPPPPKPEETQVIGPEAAIGSGAPGGAGKFDYELLGELGRGGMGVVYHARQISLNRPVALKMILAGAYASEEFLLRFRAEAETVAQLHHPNVVAVYEVGTHQHQPYFSMEFVPGETLAGRIARGPLTPDEAVACLAAVARGVQHVHDLGVLHRDLKPSNILLDANGQPRITDFGVAKRLKDTASITVSGQTLGTPAYIAPEQISAHQGAISVRSDVYSLGAILFHALTGQMPFQGESAEAVLDAVRNDEAPLLRSVKPDLPRDLETICERCMAKDPARRLPSAAAFADALERWRAGLPILIRPVGLAERAVLWAKRKPAVAALSVACAVTLLAGFVGVLWEWGVAERHRRAAEAGREEMRATTVRVQSQEAERLFEAHRSQEALALLAASVRLDPSNRVTASRLASALTRRNFALPVAPAFGEGQQVIWAGISPSGSHVATISEDNRLGFWDVQSGEAVASFPPPSNLILNVVFSADGRTVMESRDGFGVVFHDPTTGAPVETIPVPGMSCVPALASDSGVFAAGLEDGKVVVGRRGASERREFAGHTGVISWLDFSADGQWLATAADDGTACLWSTRSNYVRAAQVSHGQRIRRAALCPQARRLATVSSNTLALWSLPSGEVITNFICGEEVFDMKFSPDGARLALGTRAGNVRLYAAQTGAELLCRTGHTRAIHALAFSPDGQVIASASDDTTVQLWDVHTGELVAEPVSGGGPAVAVDFSADGSLFVSATRQGTAVVRDTRPGMALPRVLWEKEHAWEIALKEAPRELITVSRMGTVRAWNPHDGSLRRVIHESSAKPALVLFGPGAGSVLIADTGGLVNVIDVGSGRCAAMEARTSAQAASAFSPDGSLVAIGNQSSVQACWAADGRAFGATSRCEGGNGITCKRMTLLAFSPDHRWLASACDAAHVRVWDAQTGGVVAEFPCESKVVGLEFFPDSQRLLAATMGGGARIWALTNATRPLLVLRHRERMMSARLSPDGAAVLTSAVGGEVAIWGASSGVRLAPPMVHRKLVSRGFFSPDGGQVITQSEDATWRRWDARTGLPVEEACTMAGSSAWPVVAAAAGWEWFASGIRGPVVQIWHDAAWPMPVPDWLPTLAEAVGGIRLETTGVERVISPGELLRLRKRIGVNTADDVWTRWGRWLLANRENRTLAWDSDVTLAQQIKAADTTSSLADLRFAVRLCPTNGVLLARLALASLDDSGDPCRTDEAVFLSRRAGLLEGESPVVKRIQGELHARLAEGPVRDVQAR